MHFDCTSLDHKLPVSISSPFPHATPRVQSVINPLSLGLGNALATCVVLWSSRYGETCNLCIVNHLLSVVPKEHDKPGGRLCLSFSAFSASVMAKVYRYFQPPTRLEDASAELHPDPKCIAEPEPRWITSMVAVPLSTMFFTGSWDGHVRAWKISEDKRRIESMGPLQRAESSVIGTALVSADQQHEAAFDVSATARGVVNDLALFERGDRGRDGIFVVAAVGKEHRLGRWLKVPGGKNETVMYRLSRRDKALNGTSDDIEEDS